jgi:hypothetical protein
MTSLLGTLKKDINRIDMNPKLKVALIVALSTLLGALFGINPVVVQPVIEGGVEQVEEWILESPEDATPTPDHQAS